jgi:hypothetical protein
MTNALFVVLEELTSFLLYPLILLNGTPSFIIQISALFHDLFSMTALGVYDGDFMYFDSGVSAVTLSGGRTYHQMIPPTEGQHAI